MECPPWPLAPACLPDGWDPDDLTVEQQAAVERASAWLRAATGGLWGPCTVAGRFCPPEGAARCAPGPCACGTSCSLELKFPAQGPVTFIVDGSIERHRWEIVEYQTLYRLDGLCWPACADLMVTYTQGWPVLAGDAASIAMTRLAVRLWQDPCPAAECGTPPEGWTQIQRDGWTVERDESKIDALGIFGSLTGLPSVDSWLRLVRVRYPVTVHSLDVEPAGGVAVTDTGF